MVPKLIHNLAPPREAHYGGRATLLTALFSLSGIQLAHLFSGWLALSCDSIDMFNVILSSSRLTEQFHQPKIVMMIMISLNSLFRIVGGFLFGILSDRFGRKWPLVSILLFSSLLQFGTGFAQTLELLFLLRCLSGLVMGGVWGIAVSNALENLPVETRGLASGILAQGYAVGFLVSAIMNTYIVPYNRYTWCTLFWIGSGMMALAAIVRALHPESQAFLCAHARRVDNSRSSQGSSVFREVGRILKSNWKSTFLCVAIVANLNAALHGTQDLYPTYLVDVKRFTVRDATITAMVGSSGAISGGVVAGSLSQLAGRRLTIILFLLLGGVFIPLWILPSTPTALRAGVFWVQFGVQGASGVVPIWLSELSPPGFLAFFPGFVAQLGNMLGSGSGEIETLMAGAKHLKKTIVVKGKSAVVPGYEIAMCVVTGITILLAMKFLLIVSENHGSRFEVLNATLESEEDSFNLGFSGHAPPRPPLSSDEEKKEEKPPHLTVKDVNLEVSERIWSRW